MAVAILRSQESTLVGLIVNAELTTTGLSVQVAFTDSKTGVARTPQSTTLDFVIDKDNSRYEQIRATSHTTAAGVTTITIAGNGRAVPLYGTGAGGATGQRHPIGAQIGCVYTHNQVEELNKVVDGTNGTSARNFRVGDETDNNITYYAQNSDANKPFIRYNAATNQWLISNDGINTYDPQAGGSGVTAGDGISLTAGDLDIDLTDTVIFRSVRAGNETRVPITLLATGRIDTSFITAGALASYISDVTSTAAELNKLSGASANVTAANLGTLTAGSASNADTLHTHNTFATQSMTAGEAIDGTPTPRPVCIGSTSYRSVRRTLEMDWNSGSGATNNNMGDADATTRVAQQFTITDALATSITVASITINIADSGAPADDTYIEIQQTTAGLPNGTVVTNGTSNSVTGATITGTNITHTYTFATPPTIVSGTVYAFVIRRSGANDAGNYYLIRRSNAATIVEGGSTTYTASTATWAAITTTSDIFYEMILTKSYGGRAFLTDANNPPVCRCDGFATSDAAAAGNAVNVQPIGIVSGLSGLTAGQKVYASTTAGNLTHTPTAAQGSSTADPDVVVPIGKAYGTTSLVYQGGTLMAHGTFSTLRHSSGTRSYTYFVETGFRPDYVRFTAEGNFGANNFSMGQLGAFEGTEMPDLLVSDLSAAGGSGSNNVVTVQTEVAVTSDFDDDSGAGGTISLTVGTVYDSGFEIVFAQSGTGPITQLNWMALGH